MQILTIDGKLPGLNEYTKANRTNPYVGAQMKKNAEQIIRLCIRNDKIAPVAGAVSIRFKWYEKDRRRDLDNICFAKKFILDSLVKENIIANDDWQHVRGFTDEFFVDKRNPRIEVEIKKVKKG